MELFSGDHLNNINRHAGPNHVSSREELAQKLDKDLDQHIQNILEKNKGYKYEDSLDPDKLDEVSNI